MAKILFVSGWYPTDDRPSFGIFVRRHAETAALNNEVSVLYVRMISSHSKKAIEVQTGTKNSFFEVIMSINKNKLGFPPLSSLLKFIFYIRSLIKGYKIIVAYSGKPDLVHANILYEGGRQALLIKWLYGIPFVCTEHWTGYLPEDGTYKGFFKKFLSRVIASRAKFILPVSNLLSKAMQSHGLNGNYRVIPNVVNTKVFQPLSNVAKNKNQVLHISSLDERQKNFAGILNAFKTLSASNTDSVLVVAGGEKNIKQAKTMASGRGLSNIIFSGYLSEEKLADTFRSTSFFVLFSNYETQGCVVLESLACGTPVIVPDLEVLREVVNENNGILVRAGNESDLADAMKKMVSDSDKYSPEKLSKYIQQNFSYEKVNQLLNEVYNKTSGRN